MNKLSIEICERIKSVIGDAKVGLHEPFFNSLEKENLSDCINSSYVSSVGEYVNIFEKMIEEFTKSKKAIALVNGTSALHLALKVSRIKPNEEIICPSLTFVAQRMLLVMWMQNHILLILMNKHLVLIH